MARLGQVITIARSGRWQHAAAVRAGVTAIAAVLIVVAAAGDEPGRVAGEIREVVVARGDTLHAISARHGAETAVIALDNGIAPAATLRVGQRLRVDGRHIVPRLAAPASIVVNVPQRMLFLDDGHTVHAWPVAVGRRNWPTPLGSFVVLTKEEHPTWNVPASIREEARRAGRSLPLLVPPGPDNPLGDHWLGLSLGSVGIHGTNAPASIYQPVTHGCIRMHPDDIAQLFAAVRTGTPGTVIYEPVLATRAGGAILLEVHPDVYRRGDADAVVAVRKQIDGRATADEIDWQRVAAVIAERAGTPRIINRSLVAGRAR